MEFDKNLFEARIFHGLKSLFEPGDTLPPRYLEHTICRAFGMKHVGDGNFYADGIKGSIQASIKTRMLNPVVLKRQCSGRDFLTHPDKFLGMQTNAKQKINWAGLEFVQRRQEISNESSSSPRRTGLLSLRGFRENIVESYRKFGTDTSYEILCTHGYNWRRDRYIVARFWQEYATPKTKDIIWGKDSNGIYGSTLIDGVLQRIIYRVRDGSRREATCFKEYKNPTKYKYSATIEVPIPDPWPFDQTQILAEINNLKANHHVSILFQQ